MASRISAAALAARPGLFEAHEVVWRGDRIGIGDGGRRSDLVGRVDVALPHRVVMQRAEVGPILRVRDGVGQVRVCPLAFLRFCPRMSDNFVMTISGASKPRWSECSWTAG